VLLRELFVRLGLDVDAASFAEGAAAVEIAKAGLGLVADAANAVSEVFIDSVDAAGGWEVDLSEAAERTVDHFQKAADEAKSISDYVSAEIRVLWAEVLRYVLPAIQMITDYVRANLKFYGEQFGRLADYIKKNWDTIKVVLIVGAAAITAAMVALHWASVKAALASAAAWLAAAWPFILIGGLIAGVLVALDDVRVYLQGGDSMLGRWMKRWRALVDQWKDAPADKRPWWYSILVAITREGAIGEWFAKVKGWISDLWASIQAIDWSPFTRVFTWLGDQILSIDWGEWAKRIKAAVLTIADEVKSVDFKSWVLRIEGFILKLQYAYLVAKNLVAMIGRAYDTLSGLGRSLGGAGDWAKGLFRRKAGEPAAAPEAAGPPGSGVLAATPGELYGAGPADYFAGGATATAGSGVLKQEFKTTHQWSITQLPGEDGATFAQRVGDIVDAKQQAANDDAAAAIPAVE
jgi:hypothetical protein